LTKKSSVGPSGSAPKGPERKLSKEGIAATVSNKSTKSKQSVSAKSAQAKDKKTSLSNNKVNEADMSSFATDKYLPEIPELDEILDMPKNVKEEAFVRAVCTAHKARVKANKKAKQNLAWLHTESEN
jgi:hypothetical protein